MSKYSSKRTYGSKARDDVHDRRLDFGGQNPSSSRATASYASPDTLASWSMLQLKRKRSWRRISARSGSASSRKNGLPNKVRQRSGKAARTTWSLKAGSDASPNALRLRALEEFCRKWFIRFGVWNNSSTYFTFK